MIEYFYLFSMIAVIGLIENSSVILVASMLISPLMVSINGFVLLEINHLKFSNNEKLI